MKILTADQIRRVETLCFERYSTEAELMLKAGTACFEAMTAEYDMKGKTVKVLCGNGKNAGDGFVIARLLYCFGAKAEIVICDKQPEIAEPLMYFEQAKSSGVPVTEFENTDLNCSFIVDTLFGIGFHGEPRAPFDTVFKAVNESAATVVSVDTPSGTDSTTGAVCTNCIKADFTIAISTLKFAHVLPPANSFCGKTVTVSIGIPEDCYDEEYVNTIEHEEIKALFGKPATKAALRSGAGLVKLTIPGSAYPLAAAHLTQSIFNPVYETEEGTFSASAAAGILKDLPWASSIVLGCGMGLNEDTAAVTLNVLENANCPVILDADGINAIKESISIIRDIKVPLVLTPHPGEMARLISKQVAEIQANRINIAKARVYCPGNFSL